MAPGPVQYLDRESGELRTEPVLGEGPMRFLYQNPLGRLLEKGVLSIGAFSHVYGVWQRSRLSRGAIPGFIARLGIDPAEASRPLADYASLDAFFTRHLREGARPLDPDLDVLLSPADGRTFVVPELTEETGLQVKGSRVTLDVLLGDRERASRYVGGAAVVVRLAPADYHRFHFPADGEAGPSWRIGRRLHSVHTIALESGAPSFANKRELTELETSRFGRVTLIEVGAMIVGTIVQTYEPGPVERGQEKGYFRFGGSTVVLLLEPGRVTLDADLVEASANDTEVFLKMGTSLGRSAGASA